MHSRKAYWAILGILSLIWGSSYILIKKSLVAFSPTSVASLRLFITAVVLLPLLPRALKAVDRKIVWLIAGIALVSTGLPAILYPYAQTKIDSGITGVINATVPLFTFTFGLLFFSKAFTIGKVTGVLLGLLGVVLLIIDASQIAFSGGVIFIVITLLAPMCYGLGSNLTERHLNKVNALHLTVISFVFLGLLAIFPLCLSDTFEVLLSDPFPKSSFISILLLSVFGTALASVLFFWVLQKTSAMFAATVTYFMPIIALLWGVFDGETISLFHIGAISFILAGVYLINRRPAKTPA